jgi:hypothetical protein
MKNKDAERVYKVFLAQWQTRSGPMQYACGAHRKKDRKMINEQKTGKKEKWGCRDLNPDPTVSSSQSDTPFGLSSLKEHECPSSSTLQASGAVYSSQVILQPRNTCPEQEAFYKSYRN